MSLLPPLGQSNPELRDALKRFSATKYGKPRAEVEREFFKRMSIGDEVKKQKMEALKKAQEERMAAFRAGGTPGMNQGSALPGTPAGGLAAASSGQPAGGMTGTIPAPAAPPQPPSFLDEWLQKRQQIMSQPKDTVPVNVSPAFGPTTQPAPMSPASTVQPAVRPQAQPSQGTTNVPKQNEAAAMQPQASNEPEKLNIRDSSANTGDDGVSVKLR
jgi:hypothetical protein